MPENISIKIPLSESDIYELKEGKSFDWTFKASNGESIDVRLFLAVSCDSCGEDVESLNEVTNKQGELMGHMCDKCSKKYQS